MSWIRERIKSWKEGSATDQAMVILTFMFVVITIPLIIFGYYQIDISRDIFRYQRNKDRADDSTQAIRDSISKRNTDSSFALTRRIADSSIALSKSIAATQMKFAKIELRAYVAIEFDSIAFSVNAYYTYWNLTNVGKTPARRVRTNIHYSLANTTPEFQKKVPLPSIGFDIGAGRTWPRKSFLTQNPAVVDSIYRMQRKMFVSVKVGYEDIFGVEHFTYANLILAKFSVFHLPIPDGN